MLTAVFGAAHTQQSTLLYLSYVTMFSEILKEVHVLICLVKHFLPNTHSMKIQDSTFLPYRQSSSTLPQTVLFCSNSDKF